MDYNVQFDEVEVTAVAGDTIDLTYSVTDNGDAFTLTAHQLDLDLYADTNPNTATKTWSSGGSSPEITISTSSFNIADAVGFASRGIYTGWLRNTTDDYCIAKFTFNVI